MRLPVLGQTAEWLVLQGQWSQAEQRYQTLLDELPDAGLVHRKLAQLLLRQGRRLEAATHLRQSCRLGDIEELDLRALLMVVHPFPGDAIKDQLDPIGSMGQARYEISQGNLDAAIERLQQSTTPSPATAALMGASMPCRKILNRSVNGSRTQPIREKRLPTIGLLMGHTGLTKATIKPPSSALAKRCFVIKRTPRPTPG